MGKDEWITPPEIIKALGPFDLDPCAAVGQPWKTAEMQWTKETNGLSCSWHGRVWCNPPYGQQTAAWLWKLANHGDGIALIFARTETDMFFRWVWEKASGILFIRGRLHFYHVDGTRAISNSGAPSCLIAYGERNMSALAQSGISGRLITVGI